MNEKAIRNAELELRRGILTLSVLSQLQTRQYGYSLLQALTDHGLEIDQNTLYPLLRRLEQQGFLDSDWSVAESRPRRYYVLNQQGKEALQIMLDQWQQLVATMERLLPMKEELQ